MEPTIFNIEQFDLKFYQNHETKIYRIELYDDQICVRARYRCDVTANTEDESLGFKRRIFDYTMKIKRSAFILCEKAYFDEMDYWMIKMEAQGVTDEIGFFFKKNDKAFDEVFEMLCKFVFTDYKFLKHSL